MAYQPIDDYGIVGNLHTSALIGKNGSIDWMCLPRFDSPSVFAAILDDQKGGYFRIAPITDEITRRQIYWPDSIQLCARPSPRAYYGCRSAFRKSKVACGIKVAGEAATERNRGCV